MEYGSSSPGVGCEMGQHFYRRVLRCSEFTRALDNNRKSLTEEYEKYLAELSKPRPIEGHT